MLRHAANLTYLFTEMPMLQRFAAARRAGFEGVEILFPYDLAVKDLVQAAQAAGVEFVLMNMPPPNWAGGPRGFAAEPDNRARFRSDFDRALRFAHALRVRHLHVMAGVARGPLAHRTMVENLAWACARAPQLSLTIEPMSDAEMPGYFLTCYDQAAGIVAEVGAPNLGLQFDLYHAQMIHGDAMAVWQRHAAMVRHVQVAGYPQRHEPDHGTCDFPGFVDALRRAGFDGWIGAEYQPRVATEAGLAWLDCA